MRNAMFKGFVYVNYGFEMAILVFDRSTVILFTICSVVKKTSKWDNSLSKFNAVWKTLFLTLTKNCMQAILFPQSFSTNNQSAWD